MATDPKFGDHPYPVLKEWNRAILPGLREDPEWRVWREVVVELLLELLESQWRLRHRRALLYAEADQLAEWSTELGFICPISWSEDRCRAVLTALYQLSFQDPTPDGVWALLEASIEPPQTAYFEEVYPAGALFTLLESDSNTAIAVFTALDRARARGVRYRLISHPGDGAAPFIVGSSTVGGPDTVASMLE